MIGFLTGKVLDKQPPELLLDVNGVGYEVTLPMTSFYQLPGAGEDAAIFTHFVVREDAQLLYGFTSKHERALFRLLIKVNGVGPKLALAILSGMSSEQFVVAVERGELAALTKLPGVGKKTAERLLVEMRDKLKDWLPQASLASDAFSLQQPMEDTFIRPPDAKEDAIAALEALGYKSVQAEKAVKQVATDGASSEDLIRLALKAMM